MINIYGLFDPRTNTPFYVGATKQPIVYRLHSHMGDINKISGIFGNTPVVRKGAAIRSIVNDGLKPEIRLLAISTPEYVDALERFFYDLFTSQGHELHQSSFKFNYQKEKISQ